MCGGREEFTTESRRHGEDRQDEEHHKDTKAQREEAGFKTKRRSGDGCFLAISAPLRLCVSALGGRDEPRRGRRERRREEEVAEWRSGRVAKGGWARGVAGQGGVRG